MATVAVHPPKTPVTKGSNTVAAATIPNICKMPGPPAPFVPTPLPNIGRSALSPKGYSKKVKIEGNPVAIGGANFASQGDIASKGTGGGLVSSNTHGVTKFIMPGSFTVKIEGKGVHLLGEPMLNNCGPSGSPPNAATMQGATHAPTMVPPTPEEILQKACCECDEEVSPGPYDSCATLGEKKHECCEKKLTGEEGVGGERGYNRDGTPFTNGPRSRMPGESYGDFRGRIRGCAFPDACALDAQGNPTKFYDFKFGCEKDVPIWVSKDGRRGALARGTSRPDIGKKQRKKYQSLARKLGMADDEPESISNKDC